MPYLLVSFKKLLEQRQDIFLHFLQGIPPVKNHHKNISSTKMNVQRMPILSIILSALILTLPMTVAQSDTVPSSSTSQETSGYSNMNDLSGGGQNAADSKTIIDRTSTAPSDNYGQTKSAGTQQNNFNQTSTVPPKGRPGTSPLSKNKTPTAASDGGPMNSPISRNNVPLGNGSPRPTDTPHVGKQQTTTIRQGNNSNPEPVSSSFLDKTKITSVSSSNETKATNAVSNSDTNSTTVSSNNDSDTTTISSNGEPKTNDGLNAIVVSSNGEPRTTISGGELKTTTGSSRVGTQTTSEPSNTDTREPFSQNNKNINNNNTGNNTRELDKITSETPAEIPTMSNEEGMVTTNHGRTSAQEDTSQDRVTEDRYSSRTSESPADKSTSQTDREQNGIDDTWSTVVPSKTTGGPEQNGIDDTWSNVVPSKTTGRPEQNGIGDTWSNVVPPKTTGRPANDESVSQINNVPTDSKFNDLSSSRTQEGSDNRIEDIADKNNAFGESSGESTSQIGTNIPWKGAALENPVDESNSHNYFKKVGNELRPMPSEDSDAESSSAFVVIFLSIVSCVFGYVGYHNRKAIMDCFTKTRGRGGDIQYSRLRSKPEILPTSHNPADAKQYIY